jgi:hypothetical protein
MGWGQLEKMKMKDDKKIRREDGKVLVVVLNDGETYTDLSGCVLIELDADTYEKAINQGLDVKDMDNLATGSWDLEALVTDITN